MAHPYLIVDPRGIVRWRSRWFVSDARALAVVARWKRRFAADIFSIFPLEPARVYRREIDGAGVIRWADPILIGEI